MRIRLGPRAGAAKSKNALLSPVQARWEGGPCTLGRIIRTAACCRSFFGGNDVGINPLPAASGTVLAVAVLMLAPVPAHADYVCWTSDGTRYCYDPGDRQVPEEPSPAPVEPPYTPPPPAPSVEQPSEVPAAAVPVQPAPVLPGPAPAPAGEVSVPARPVPAPVYVPPQPNAGVLPSVEAAALVPVPAEADPVVTPSAGAAPPADAPAAAVTPASADPSLTAAPSPSAPEAANIATDQASSTASFSSLWLVIAVVGVTALAAAWAVYRRRKTASSL
jgi:hypothetical protein